MAVALTRIRPVRTPFANAKTLTAVEWTTDIREYNSTGSDFRMDATFVLPYGGGTFISAVQNAGHHFTPGDYHVGDGIHTAITYVAEVGLYWSEQYDWTTSGQFPGGVEPIVSPTLHPQQAHVWENVDGGVADYYGGDTFRPLSSQMYSRVNIASDLPAIVRWRATLVGFVTNPAGTLHRKADGSTQALVGDFAMWKVQNEWGGSWRDIATFYLPKAYGDALQVVNGPLAINTEYSWSPNPLSACKTDTRFSDLRVFDSATASWHDLLEWQVYDVESPGGDHGWNVSLTTGKLASRAGYAGDENTVNRYLLGGLTYRRGDTLAALAFASVGDVVAGSATYNGPFWNALGGVCLVQQERGRGFYIVRPEATADVHCVYTVTDSGVYRFTGDFARANTLDAFPGNDGVTVFVKKSATTLYSGSIPASAGPGVNPADPFANSATGAVAHFDVSALSLAAGEQVSFIVKAGATHGFDETAFRVSVSFVKSAAPPPSGGGGTGNVRAISTDLLKDLLLQSSEEGLMPLLTVTWNDGVNVGTMRLALHDQNVTSNGFTFLAATFGVRLPDEDNADVPLLQIGIQDVDLSVRTELRKLDSRFPAMITLQLVLLSDNDSVEQTFAGTIRNIKTSVAELVASVELYSDLSREPLTQFRMTTAYGFNALRSR